LAAQKSLHMLLEESDVIFRKDCANQPLIEVHMPNGVCYLRRWANDSMHIYDADGSVFIQKYYRFNAKMKFWEIAENQYKTTYFRLLQQKDSSQMFEIEHVETTTISFYGNQRTTKRYWAKIKSDSEGNHFFKFPYHYESSIVVKADKTERKISLMDHKPLQTPPVYCDTIFQENGQPSFVTIKTVNPNWTPVYSEGGYGIMYKKSNEELVHSNIIDTKNFHYNLNGQLLFREDTNFILDKDNLNCFYGFRNQKGDWVVPPQYDNVEEGYYGYIVTIGTKKGAIWKNGTPLLPVKYDKLSGFYVDFETTDSVLSTKHATFDAVINGKKRLIFGDGTPVDSLVIDATYGDIMLQIQRNQDGDNLYYKFYIEKDTQYYGLLDSLGNVLIPAKYLSLDCIDENHIIVAIQEDTTAAKLYGLINMKGEYVLPPIYYGMQKLDSGRVAVIAPRTDQYARLKFADLVNTIEALPKAKRDSLQKLFVHAGIFDVKRGWILDTAYYWYDGSGGIGRIYQNNHSTFTRFNYIGSFKEYQKTQYVFVARRPNGGIGLATADGRILIPMEYDEIVKYYHVEYKQRNEFRAERNGTTFLWCRKGKKVGIWNTATQKWSVPVGFYDTLVPFEYYKQLGYNSNGFLKTGFWGLRKQRWHFIDGNQQPLLSQTFKDVSVFINFRTADITCVGITDTGFYMTNGSYFPKQIPSSNLEGKPFLLKSFTEKYYVLTPDKKNTTFKDAKFIKELKHQDAFLMERTDKTRFIVYLKKKKSTWTIEQVDVPKNCFVGRISNDLVELFNEKRDKFGFIDLETGFTAPPQYHRLIWEDGSILLVQNTPSSPHKMHNRQLKRLNDTNFDPSFYTVEKTIYASVNQQKGAWAQDGRMLMPPQYDDLWLDTLSGNYVIKKELTDGTHKLGIVDTTQRVIFPTVVDRLVQIGRRFLGIQVGNSVGIIARKDGQFLVRPNEFPYFKGRLLDTLIKDISEQKSLQLTKYFGLSGKLYEMKKDTMFTRLPDSVRYPLENLWIGKFLSGTVSTSGIFDDANNHVLFDTDYHNSTTDSIEKEKDGSDTVKVVATDYFHKENSTIAYRLLLVAPTDSFVSFMFEISKFDNTGVSNYLSSMHYVKKNGIYQPFQLSDLLKPNADLFINGLLQAEIGKLKFEKIDCSNIAAFYDRSKQTIAVQESGIVFYVPRSSEDNWNHVPILLRWEALASVLLRRP
jgi:hypothetical protein